MGRRLQASATQLHGGWVDYVGTWEASQRRGLGRAALIAGLRWLREQGAHTTMLVTMDGNVPARSVYDALDFDVVERDLVYTCAVTME